MTDQLKEQISALVDDHLPEAEQEMLIARLTREKGLADCWYRYHLIRDALRQHLTGSELTSVSSRVRQALEDEPALSGASNRGKSSWLKPMAGFAVAASVAVMAILGVRNLQVVDAPPVVATADNLPRQEISVPQVVRVRGTHWNVDTPRVADKLNSYLVNHSEYAASGGMRSIGPHARIVGYESSNPGR